MATLTQSQIYTIALLTGMDNPKLMAAIAMAESSGRTDVVNSIGCVGLWQINQPVHVKANPTWTKEWLKNPINNALAAKKIYASQGLRAWEVYTNGMYLRYMGSPVKKEAGSLDEVRTAAWLPGIPEEGDDSLGDLLMPNSVGDSVGATLEVARGVKGVAESIQKGTLWIIQPKNWARVGYVIGGGIIVALALKSLAANTALGRAAGDTVKGAASVLPGGGTARGAGRAIGSAVKKKVKK